MQVLLVTDLDMLTSRPNHLASIKINSCGFQGYGLLCWLKCISRIASKRNIHFNNSLITGEIRANFKVIIQTSIIYRLLIKDEKVVL
jgi:hypothetical protein